VKSQKQECNHATQQHQAYFDGLAQGQSGRSQFINLLEEEDNDDE
jgi:hypothetical protein